VQALEHRLEHARPFGAVAGQLRGRGRGGDCTHTSMEPSRAASSSICSLDNMLPSVEHPAQVRAAQRLGKLGWRAALMTVCCFTTKCWEIMHIGFGLGLL
jgi:hypothetical protein